MENDWWDMLNKSGSYKYPYRIQWCLRSGKVRAKHDNQKEWLVEDCCVNAKYALHIGYDLLTKGENYEKAKKMAC